MRRQLVSVCCEKRTESALPVWAALEELVPVRFCFDPGGSALATRPLILTKPDEVMLTKAVAAGLPAFVFASPTAAYKPLKGSIAFCPDALLDARIRGRTLQHEDVRNFAPLTPGSNDVVLATHAGKPIWIRRRLHEADVQIVGVPFPVFGSGELPFDYLNGGRFIHLLPLLHFLRQIVGDAAWQPPALRACIMFDDPNLHWSSYGFLPFRETTALADRFNFHVACATVPLDSWYVHAPTAALFRQNGKRISLLMHGNDHLLQELGLVHGENAEIQLLAQALQRIDRLEERAGFRVSRVMAPPHGACRPNMTQAMSRLGFDGACISPWSLRDWGEEGKWPCAFGLRMAEMIGHFPVVPRFRACAGCEGWIVINAFLNRPIIPVGHHDTLSDGLDLLVKLAGIVNSLPNVEWCNMEQILLSNYLVRREGATLCVHPFAARMQISVPDDVTSLRIESDTLDQTPSRWRLRSNGDAGRSEFALSPGPDVELCLEGWGQMNYREIRPGRSSPWAPVRRILCEVRDRIRPVLYRKRNANAST